MTEFQNQIFILWILQSYLNNLKKKLYLMFQLSIVFVKPNQKIISSSNKSMHPYLVGNTLGVVLTLNKLTPFFTKQIICYRGENHPALLKGDPWILPHSTLMVYFFSFFNQIDILTSSFFFNCVNNTWIRAVP